MVTGNDSTRRRPLWARRVSLAVFFAAVGLGVALFILICLTIRPSETDRRKRMTRHLVVQLDLAMRHFRAGFGQTPDKMPARDLREDVNRRVRRWLTGLDDNGNPDEAVRGDPRWQGPYVEPDPRFLDVDRDHILVDSWGNPILFEFDDPIFNPGTWDIWSLGPDGKGSSSMADLGEGTPEQRRRVFEQLKQGRRLVNADSIGNWD